MRAERNGSSSSFETRARSLVFAKRLRRRAPQDEDEHRAQFLFTCQTADLVPAARFCVRVLHFGFATPNEGVAERRESSGACEAPVACSRRQAGALRGALRPHTGDARLPALSPWRFWATGPRFPSPALRPDRSQRTPRIRVVVPGGGAPASRGDSCEPPPQDASFRASFLQEVENRQFSEDAAGPSTLPSTLAIGGEGALAPVLPPRYRRP
jgi:hypothetical protein